MAQPRIDTIATQAADLETRAGPVQRICDEVGLPIDIDAVANWIQRKSYLKELLRNVFDNGRLAIDTDIESAYGVVEAYSRLVSADKIDAAGYLLPNRRQIPSTAVDQYVRETFGAAPSGSINELREQARTEVRDTANAVDLSESLFELTLPTGLGKTLTGLDAALTLRSRIAQQIDYAPRIVYTVPYTAIIDQNFDEFRSVLDAVCENGADPALLLKHHYRSDATYVTEHTRDADEDAGRALMLTDRWESELIATTFVQLLESLIVPSNAQALKLPNLEHAVVLIDEIQAIPASYWDVVQEVLTVLGERWNCTFIVMTATQPGLFETAPSLLPENSTPDHIGETAPNQYFEALDRVMFHFDESIRTDSLSHQVLAERVASTARSNVNADILIVCNTIDSAQTLFELLTTTAWDEATSCLFLSSGVRPCDRRQRLKRLRSAHSDERFIVVSTQVVEAGVDIDMDVVYRDFAPLDSLVQAAGRCNRNAISGSHGRVTVVSIADDGEAAPATAVYDAPRLDATRRTLEDACGVPGTVSEATMTGSLVEAYFATVDEVKQTDESVDDLLSWQFSDGSISIIDDVLTADVFITTEEETDEHGESPVFTSFKEAVQNREHSEIVTQKPTFYDHVVSVNIYTETSETAKQLQSLPLPDTDLGVYYLNADSPQYREWYDANTGFTIPKDTVDMRLI